MNVFSSQTAASQKSVESQRGGRQQSKAAAAAVKKGSELKRNNGKAAAQGELAGKQGAANSKRVPKKGAKELRAQKGDNSAVVSQGGHESLVCSASRAKAETESTNGLTVCRYVGNVYFKLLVFTLDGLLSV